MRNCTKRKNKRRMVRTFPKCQTSTETGKIKWFIWTSTSLTFCFYFYLSAQHPRRHTFYYSLTHFHPPSVSIWNVHLNFIAAPLSLTSAFCVTLNILFCNGDQIPTIAVDGFVKRQKIFWNVKMFRSFAHLHFQLPLLPCNLPTLGRNEATCTEPLFLLNTIQFPSIQQFS